MKLVRFQSDARRKTLQGREVYDYLALGWQIVPRAGGKPGTASVRANFPPDLARLEARLACGWVEHERKEVRESGKNRLVEVRFDYVTASRGTVRVTADHQQGALVFRLANVAGFEVQSNAWPAEKISSAVLDELAKRIVGEASRFV